MNYFFDDRKEMIKYFKEMSTKDFYRKVEEFYQFLITLYLLLILSCYCEKHKKSYKVSKLFRFLFAVFSGFCLLLFTFRLYQCFRILSLAFMECLLSTFCFFFLLFCYLYDDAMVSVTWNRSIEDKSITQRPNATLKRCQFSKFQLTWKTTNLGPKDLPKFLRKNVFPIKFQSGGKGKQ